MPIAINGSGTVTGISVGGLPDGIVDADMLASNAVTAGKLASGVGGKILQVVNTTYNGQASLSLTSAYGNVDSNIYYITQLDTTLTTTQANSKILISGMIAGEFQEPDHLMAFIISSTIGGTTAPIDALRGTSSNNRTKLSFMPSNSFHGDDNSSTPSSTPFSNFYYAPSQAAGTAITIRLGAVSTYYSSRTFKINQAYDAVNNDEREHLCSHMTLMEVP